MKKTLCSLLIMSLLFAGCAGKSAQIKMAWEPAMDGTPPVKYLIETEIIGGKVDQYTTNDSQPSWTQSLNRGKIYVCSDAFHICGIFPDGTRGYIPMDGTNYRNRSD